MILKSYNYKTYNVPYPLPKENTWTKQMGQNRIINEA